MSVAQFLRDSRCLVRGHQPAADATGCPACGRGTTDRGWLWRVHAVLASSPNRLGTREAVRLMMWFAALFAGLSALSGSWGQMLVPGAGLAAYLLADTVRVLWAPTATLERQLGDRDRP
ncbi:hypothetical protein [Pseudactinotalea terrae]|uniref:hypothetical protein n=1 Tax=Pseudactinotalea terrae TaxID=1743262 RepID=UPI0012E13E8B|nr:hypothetical protein [Pseudactinotalea terrae]